MVNKINEIELGWVENGNLDNPNPSLEKGVYMFVFEGNPSRIVYVGTCFHKNGFNHRWKEHHDSFKCGQRTVWRISDKEDIYKLMSNHNHVEEYYKNLALNYQLWVPNSDSNKDVNFLNSYDLFFLNWKMYVEKFYLSKLKIWSCSIDLEENAKILETQIQRIFGKRFQIGYYDNYNQNWLGKQEINDIEKISSIQFGFNKYPILDDDSIKCLQNLNEHLYPMKA